MVRLLLGTVAGYAIVGVGLSLLVTAVWIEAWLPLGAPLVVGLALALVGLGVSAGWTSTRIAAQRGRTAGLAVAGLTLAVLAANMILDVAVEPLWFKALAMGLVAPSVLVVALRTRERDATSDDR